MVCAATPFVWETQGEGTLDESAIKIELTTGHQDSNGNPQKTALTDQQAMKLWDDILRSLRLRPTGDRVSANDIRPESGPLLPLGELLSTGATCTQTGWWQTSEAGEIEGGRRHRFVAGEKMPEVAFVGTSSVWDKLTGKRARHPSAATVWQLVGYEQSNSTALVATPGNSGTASAAPGSQTDEA